MNFYIVGDVDRPERRHVVQEIKPGVLKYMHNDLSHWERFVGRDGATSMETFGFDIRVKDNHVIFEQVRESKATYCDGRARQWQDVTLFTLPLLENE